MEDWTVHRSCHHKALCQVTVEDKHFVPGFPLVLTQMFPMLKATSVKKKSSQLTKFSTAKKEQINL